MKSGFATRLKKTAAVLACLAGVAAAPLATGTAQAASWLSDPGGCSGVATAASRVVSNRTVEVRYGRCNGVQHGWGRITGYSGSSAQYIRFEVDTDGDRLQDGASWYAATNRNYTAAYPTASGSTRAFRACYITSSSATCTSSNSTAWW